MTETTASFRALGNSALLRQDAYINGEWIGAAQRFSAIDPTSGAEVAKEKDFDGAPPAAGQRAVCSPVWAYRDHICMSAVLSNERFRPAMKNRQVVRLLHPERPMPGR